MLLITEMGYTNVSLGRFHFLVFHSQQSPLGGWLEGGKLGGVNLVSRPLRFPLGRQAPKLNKE